MGRRVTSHDGSSDDGPSRYGQSQYGQSPHGQSRRGRSLSSGSGSGSEAPGRRVASGTASSDSVPAGPGSGDVSSASAEHGSGRTVRSQRADVSAADSGRFVDARVLRSGESVSERLDSEAFGGPGLLTRPKVVDFPERLKERRKANRRQQLTRMGVAALIVVAVLTLIWALLFSPLLKLQADQITVRGTNTWVSKGDVTAIADTHVGSSLLLVSGSGIEEKIGELPGVVSAQASKRYPHGLDIVVKAEPPAAVLKDANGDMTAVDSEGRVLNAVNASVKGIPVIEVKNAKKSLDNKAVIQAVKVLGTLDESMRRKVSKVTAKTQDSVTTTLADGYTVIWGNSSQMRLKKAVVDTLLKNPKQLGGAKTINVAAPDKATIK
ncbi:cell division protein FtsQ/DivIB [Bifidobacterium simiarum]|uniref:cell division protein FtsQ/DivIB n=1 Tax=Bifidobacterium simiarum TaxID=2045441 RepID=UPI0030B81202